MNQRQYYFLQAMLEEGGIGKAAEKAGISRVTAYKYLKNSEFQSELTKRRCECLADTVHYLQGKLTICSEELI